MSTLLRVLFVEDSDDDMQLMIREIQKGGYDLEWDRVDTRAAMQAALTSRSWDLIISDHSMPQFSSMQALYVLKSSGQDLPFLLISGSIGEDAAVAALKAGVDDFLIKGNWARLIPAIQRELRETETRRERKKAGDALRAAEARLSGILDLAADAIIVIDEEQRVILFNQSAEHIFGYRMDEVVGHPLDILLPSRVVKIHQEHVHAFRDAPEIARRMGKRLEIFGRRKDGREFPADASISKLDQDGEMIFTVILRDVTERKRVEQEIESLANLPQENTNSILRIARDGRLLYSNPASRNLLGHWDYETHGRLPDEIQLRAYQTLMIHMSHEVEITYGDTTESLMFVPIVNKDYANVYGRDITERRRAEIKIKQQLERLTALREIDHAITSVFDVRVSLNILLSHAKTLLGVDAATVLELNPARSALEYGAEIGFRTRLAETTEVKLSESYAGTAAREQRLVHIPNLANDPKNFLPADFLIGEGLVSYYGMPLIVKGTVVGVMEVFHRSFLERDQDWLDFFSSLAGQAAIAIDNARLFDHLQRSNIELEHRVTERTAELNRTNAELERANRAKDEFLANMSHELRTPLNSILGLSESLLEQRRDPLSDHQKNSLQIIESSGRHLLELINDVLDLSKIEAGMLDYYPQVVDVDALCRSSLAFVKEQATRKFINITYVKEDTMSEIYADPRRLKQILVNLLTNAVKFTPAHGQVTLQVKADVEQDLVQFSVIDTGIGIAPEDLGRLFTPFVQVDSNLNRQFEGTGLGLALVQKLTDLHGGSVQVESEVGAGSRFTINLPWGRKRVAEYEVTEVSDKHLAGENGEKSSVTSAASSNRGTILLAEDNRANILTIGEYLESYGYRIVIAHDGLEAIEKAEEMNPDIILMDIQMPIMDGLEAIRRLRENPRFRSTPTIALTALAMPGDRERCLAAGANEYMSKPVGLRKLLYTINEMLDREE